jgi:hypothetical protein
MILGKMILEKDDTGKKMILEKDDTGKRLYWKKYNIRILCIPL